MRTITVFGSVPGLIFCHRGTNPRSKTEGEQLHQWSVIDPTNTERGKISSVSGGNVVGSISMSRSVLGGEVSPQRECVSFLDGFVEEDGVPEGPYDPRQVLRFTRLLYEIEEGVELRPLSHCDDGSVDSLPELEDEYLFDRDPVQEARHDMIVTAISTSGVRVPKSFFPQDVFDSHPVLVPSLNLLDGFMRGLEQMEDVRMVTGVDPWQDPMLERVVSETLKNLFSYVECLNRRRNDRDVVFRDLQNCARECAFRAWLTCPYASESFSWQGSVRAWRSSFFQRQSGLVSRGDVGLAYQGLAVPGVLERVKVFFGRPEYAHLTSFVMAVLDFDDEFSTFRVFLRHLDGSAVVKSVYAAAKLPVVRRSYERLLRTAWDLSPDDILRRFSPHEPKVRLMETVAVHARQKLRRKTRSHARLLKEGFELQSGFEGFDRVVRYVSEFAERVAVLVAHFYGFLTAFDANIDKRQSFSLLILNVSSFLEWYFDVATCGDLVSYLTEFLWERLGRGIERQDSGSWSFEETLAFVVTLPFMPYTSRWKDRLSWFDNARSHFTRVSGPFGDFALGSKLMSFVLRVVELGRECWEAGTFSVLFQKQSPWTDWVKEVRDHVRLEHSVGLAVDARDWMDESTRLLERGDQLIEVARRLDDKMALGLVLSVYELLRELVQREDILDKVKGARSPPFYLCLIGPPKTGKSAIVDELCIEGIEAMDKEYTPSLRFNRSPLDAFDSGLKSYHRVFVFDDLGALNAKVGSDVMVAQFNLIMGLANDQATPSVQADLRDKGKIYAQADLVIITSNLPTMDAEHFLNAPEAFYRRVRYKVVLTVKPEFRARPSDNVISEEKIAEAEMKMPGYRDFHFFTVVEFVLTSQAGDLTHDGTRINDPSLNVTVREVTIMERADQTTFFRWYRRAIRAHRVATGIMHGHASRLLAEEKCEHGIRRGRCVECYKRFGMAPVEKQGGAISACRRVAARVRGDTIEMALSYFSSIVFQEVLDGRERACAFAKALLDKTGCVYSDPAVKAVIRRAFSSLIKVGVAGFSVYHARLTPTPVTRVELKQVESFSRQAAVTDSVSYGLVMAELSKNAPSDVYQGGERVPAISLGQKCRTISMEVLRKKIRSASCVITVGGHVVAGLGVGTNSVLTVSHIFDQSDDDLQVSFGTQAYQLPREQLSFLYRDEVRDFAVFFFPHRSFGDLREYFPQRYSRFPVVDDVEFLHPLLKSDTRYTASPYVYEDTTHWCLPVNFGMGACGGVILAPIGGFPVILGMHVAGSPSVERPKALSIPLTAFSFRASLEKSRKMLLEQPPLDLSTNGLQLVADRPLEKPHRKSYVYYRLFPSVFVPLCDVGYGITSPRTNLVPTRLFGKVPDCVKRPPNFFTGHTPSGWVSPMNDVVDTLCDRRAEYPLVELDLARECVSAEMCALAGSAPRAYPLSESQSLNGLDGVRFIDAVKVKTGSGLPTRGPKERFVVGEDGARVYTAAARTSVAWLAEKLAEHVNPGVVCDLTLKDELKKVEKQIRGFAALPFGYNDLMRRLVLPVFKVIQENALYFGIAIGVNADSFEWRHIYLKHISRKYHVMYDFKNFDRSHSAEMLCAGHSVLFDLMTMMYPDDAMVCGLPWYCVASGGFAIAQWPVYNVNNTVYQADGSLASGMFHTAMVNSICQLLILRLLWIEFTKENPEWGGAHTFREHNSLTVYGDDGMCSTDAEGFDLSFFARVAAQWNLVITDPNKREVYPTSFPVEEWSFLKRSFVVDDSRGWVRAPLEKMSILKSLNFWEVPSDTSEVDGMIARINQAFMYLSVWEDQEAEDLHACVVQAFADVWPEQVSMLFSLAQARVIAYRYMEEPKTYSMVNLCVRSGLSPVEFERTHCRKSVFCVKPADAGDSTLITQKPLLQLGLKRSEVSEKFRQLTAGASFIANGDFQRD